MHKNKNFLSVAERAGRGHDRLGNQGGAGRNVSYMLMLLTSLGKLQKTVHFLVVRPSNLVVIRNFFLNFKKETFSIVVRPL